MRGPVDLPWMFLDFLALGILAIYLLLGAWRGTIASASGLLSLAAGYTAAFLMGPPLSKLLVQATGLGDLLALAVAGCASFVLTWITASILFRMLRRAAEMRRAGAARSAFDRFGGAMFGFARGALIVVLIGWMSLWLDAAQDLATDTGASAAKKPSTVAGVSGAVVESAIEAALSGSGTGGEVIARLAGRPDQAFVSMQKLIENERFQAVQDDSLFWTYLQNDSVENALNRSSFWNVVHDDGLRAQFADLGVISAEAAADPQVFREDAARVLKELGPHLKGLKDDPELQKLARDPDVMAMVESGNTIGLLTHPGVRNVVSRVSARVGDSAEL